MKEEQKQTAAQRVKAALAEATEGIQNDVKLIVAKTRKGTALNPMEASALTSYAKALTNLHRELRDSDLHDEIDEGTAAEVARLIEDMQKRGAA